MTTTMNTQQSRFFVRIISWRTAVLYLCITATGIPSSLAWTLTGMIPRMSMTPTSKTPNLEESLFHCNDLQAMEQLPSRRQFLSHQIARRLPSLFILTSTLSQVPVQTSAKADCFTDCFNSCKAILPKDLAYCNEECTDYCNQPDRQDGLSGSISANGGEVGILGGTYGAGTVVKGEDKPPVIRIPGLDFSSEKGKKLIGY
jgi:hypothetical protein